MDKSHLSDSTSTTHSLNETYSLDTSGDHILHLDSPSLSSELQNTSSVKNDEPEPVPDLGDLLQLDSTSVSSQDTSSKFLSLKDHWTMPTFHQQMFSVNNMTMNCSYYKKD